MIYPTARAVILTAVGAPIALLLGVLAPGFWPVGIAWAMVVMLASAIDGALAASPAMLAANIARPASAAIGDPFAVSVHVDFGSERVGRIRLAETMQVALATMLACPVRVAVSA